MMKILKVNLPLLILLISGSIFAAPFAETVSGRRADLAPLAILIMNTDFKEMVLQMESENLKIFKVTNPTKKDDAGSGKEVYSFLKEASLDEYKKFAEEAPDLGRTGAIFITKDDLPGSKSNVILIGVDAEPMTILHEFIHSLFESQNHEQTAAMSEMQQANRDLLRRYNFKTGKVLLNRYLLVSKQWRDEIKELCEEYTDMLSTGAALGFAEEVATEKALLELLLEKKSPYFNLQRAKDGIQGYSTNLVKQNEWIVNNVMQMQDIILTDGIDMDPEATKSERADWILRGNKLRAKLQDYIDGPLAKLKEQIKAANQLLGK